MINHAKFDVGLTTNVGKMFYHKGVFDQDNKKHILENAANKDEPRNFYACWVKNCPKDL